MTIPQQQGQFERPAETGGDAAPAAIIFTINPELDLTALAATYACQGRVRITNFLSRGAEELYAYLAACDEWTQLLKTARGVLEPDRERWRDLSDRRRAAIRQAMHNRAKRGFQYSYAALRVPAIGENDVEGPLQDFALFMQQRNVLDAMQAITGGTVHGFINGQVTSYSEGDFLTGHDDNVKGENRIAAFVLGLTKRWRPEFGGLLLFHGESNPEVTAMVPQFNTLDLFRVPQIHSVSLITPVATHDRHSLSGWLTSET